MGLTVSGKVRIKGAPARDGSVVEVWAYDANGGSERVATATIIGVDGSFSADVPDNVRQYRAIYDDGVNRGVSVLDAPTGTVSPIPTDGPLAIKHPSTLEHWRQMPSLDSDGRIKFPIPDYQQLLQMPSGAAVDEFQGSSWGSSGAPSYQQTVAGYTKKFVRLHETATEGFSTIAGACWNPNTQSIVIIGDFKAQAAASTRVMLMLGGANCYVAFNASGRLQLVNGLATTTGNINYLTLDSNVHPYMLQYILGAGVLDKSGPGIFRLSTDVEVIEGPWQVTPDDIKGLGGCGAFTPPDMYFGGLSAFVAYKAEALAKAGDRTVLDRFGWIVSNY